jgi:putative colanic acid biosynthesis acetyltransferase WcaF
MPEYQDLENFKAPKDFHGKSLIYVQLWRTINTFLFKLSPDFIPGFRNYILRLFGAKIGKGVKIKSSVKIHYPWKLKIGDHSWIGYNCDIYNLCELEVGSHVSIAHNVTICGGSHDLQKKNFEIIKMKKIEIQDEAWIANNVFIGPEVIIKKGAAIGANSSTFKNLDEGIIYVGNPAKPIKKRHSS